MSSLAAAQSRSAVPTLFVAGDSTAAKAPVAEQQGWGELLAAYFDPAKMRIENLAYGGRSSRTFVTAGDWQHLLLLVEPGDFVLLQFGHNDSGALNEEPPDSTRPLRARGTIAGIGEETQEIDNVITKQHEIVHTFGWYLRKMIADVRHKGATPIVLSLTGRNLWQDGRAECGSGEYRQWDAAVARSTHTDFIDVSRIIADRYQSLGQSEVKKFFNVDQLHTSPAGADFNAAMVVSGLRALRSKPFAAALSAAGRAVAADRGPLRDSVCNAIP
jgi:lysophospholipase L1-like esterase